MNQIGAALLEKEQPVQSLYVYSSNPAVIAPEANKVRKGLAREDLFMVVHDLFITETVMFADIVLPAKSAFELTDFYTSYWHNHIHLQEPVIQPYGESKSNTEVFRLLAKGMGFDDEALQDSDIDLINQALKGADNPYLPDLTYEQLKEERFIKATNVERFLDHLQTPSGKIELYSTKDGIRRLSGVTYVYSIS